MYFLRAISGFVSRNESKSTGHTEENAAANSRGAIGRAVTDVHYGHNLLNHKHLIKLVNYFNHGLNPPNESSC